MAKVYVKLDENNVIIEINSDIFLLDVTKEHMIDPSYIMIDEGEGDKYAHAQNNYLEKGMYDLKGKYNYIYENNSLRELSDTEKESLFPTPLPQATFEETQTDINIDADYRLSCLELGI